MAEYTRIANRRGIIPVGGILPVYDFDSVQNGAGVAVYDQTALTNGTVGGIITIADPTGMNVDDCVAIEDLDTAAIRGYVISITDLGGSYELHIQNVPGGGGVDIDLSVYTTVQSAHVYSLDPGLVHFDTKTWAYCCGQTILDPDSPLNGQTLPDLSGRYLVGFGTDGGGDIHTDPWATATVGTLVNNILNLAHPQKYEHRHYLGTNTHTHTAPNLRFQTCVMSFRNNVTISQHEGFSSTFYTGLMSFYLSGSAASSLFSDRYSYIYRDQDGDPVPRVQYTGSDGIYYTQASSGSGNTDVPSPAFTSYTDSTAQGQPRSWWAADALVTPFNIQPRSISIRYIMRIA